MRYLLEPEVAGELGPETEMDSTVHPPLVSHLQYELHGWLGDDLIESFPCLIVTKRLGALMVEADLTGFSLAPMDVIISAVVDDLDSVPLVVPEFLWLKADVGFEGDIGFSESGMLVVSERALAVLREVNLEHCDIEEIDDSGLGE